MSRDKSVEFTRLLEFLRSHRGFDFTGYKVSTLVRRVQKRMAEVGIGGYAEYTDYLEVHPDEFDPLFNTILINVTSFFRDPEAWEYVAREILPRIVEDRAPDRSIRVWSAGCATGQEAYTAAMLLASLLGEEEYRRRVKIYATDADEEALAKARSAAYDDREVESIPAELRRRFFEPGNGRHLFRVDLRRSLIFGRHDLVQDAAISRIDLLVCRNTLMYFNSETQARILARFHFALNKTGYLFLGRAETLLSHDESFEAVDLKRRVFRRSATSNVRHRLLALAPPAGAEEPINGGRQHRLRELAFAQASQAQLVVDRNGQLALANERARRLLSLVPGDVGRLLQDLEVSYRPTDLRSAIDTAQTDRATVHLPDVVLIKPDGERLQLDVYVAPLLGENGTLVGTAITFLDNTHAKQLRSDLERTHQELETAHEELQSANEELETTNEELQSTVEELETTNEELQSANEELETMNEELQATNEELRALNEQVEERSVELQQVNSFLESVLASLRAAVVVLNPRLEVEVWSRRATDLWGVLPDEAVGKPLAALDIGIPTAELVEPVREALLDGGSQPQTITLEGVNRRGRPIWCHVTCATLAGRPDGERQALLLMEELPRQ